MSDYEVIDLTREDDDEEKMRGACLFLDKVKRCVPRHKYTEFREGIQRLGRCIDEGRSVVDDVEKVMHVVNLFDDALVKEFREWCPWFPETDDERERTLLRDIQSLIDERSEDMRDGTYKELSEKLMHLYRRQ